MVMVDMLRIEMLQPKPWLAGLGRMRRSLRKNSELGMPQFGFKEWDKISIMVVVSMVKTPQPNSWLVGLGQEPW